MRPALCFLFLMCPVVLAAQGRFTLSGTLRDAKTGETLIGATVRPLEPADVGTVCNEYGFYSLTLPAGSYRIVFTSIGFGADTVDVSLTENRTLNRKIGSASTALGEVVVSNRRKEDNIRRTDIGTERLDMREIEKLPVLFGEKDILKTIQLLPGVKSAGEGASGFFVRGGSADQNLILLDEAPVYNASHLLGFFSTFNSDALKDVSIIKGNSPAQYGGRLSSVLDVKMKEGNNQDYSVAGGIGLISSRLSVEGPIQKDRSSFIVSGRRTYADMFLKATNDYKDNSLYFYDLNAKANYRINDRNRLYASGYFGQDVLGFGDNFRINWGNATATLRWNSILSAKVFSNTSLVYSNYDFGIRLNSGQSDFNINSQIRDWNLKEEISFYPNSRNSLRFGFNSIYHRITPNRFEGNAVTQDAKNSRYALENAVYANNTLKASDALTLDFGLRVSSYTIIGGDTYYVYEKGLKTDSVVLANGAFGKTYYNPEPRLQFSYLLNPASSIKGGYARNAQHLHLLSNSTSATPSDQWTGNSYNIKPETSDQISFGYFRNFRNSTYQLSAEGYYKYMRNQVDYKDGADINSAPDIESELLFGVGRAYGLELLLKKTAGRLTGWIGYTLSRTERRIEGINNGDWYAAKQDRTHDLSLVGSYRLSSRWTLSGLFVYYTGNAVTFPSGKYSLDGQTVYYYTERNAYRMPAYHRLDLSATYVRPRRGRWESSWNFGLYNVYGRENAYTITFEDDPDDPTRTRAVQTALFRWVPSITYNFRF